MKRFIHSHPLSLYCFGAEPWKSGSRPLAALIMLRRSRPWRDSCNRILVKWWETWNERHRRVAAGLHRKCSRWIVTRDLLSLGFVPVLGLSHVNGIKKPQRTTEPKWKAACYSKINSLAGGERNLWYRNRLLYLVYAYYSSSLGYGLSRL